jgi:histidinol phosphatase-like enzyme
VPKEFGGRAIDWQSSFTVGDKSCDVELAVAIGGNGYLVLTGKGRASWDALQHSSPVAGFKVFPTLTEVADDLPVAGTKQ